MATVLQSTLDVLLLNIQAQLMLVLGWPVERVIIDTEGEEMTQDTHFQADQLVFIRIGLQTPVPGFVGMGRIWSPEQVRVACVLWTRLALDEPPGYAIGLTDPVLGHEVAANMIRSALLEGVPVDDDDNWLVQEPIAPGYSDGPRRRTQDDAMWSKSIITVFMTYAPTLVGPSPAMPNPHPLPPHPPPPPPPLPDTTPPVTAITFPTELLTVSGTITVTASASDNVGVVGVQFFLDGTNLGIEDLIAPYSTSWDTTGSIDGFHQLRSLAHDAAGNIGGSAFRTVHVLNATPPPPPPPDTTPPTVSVVAPTGGTTISAIVSVLATASDDVGVVGVQLKLDGANLGSEVLVSPYQVSWDTTAVTDGSHVLSATARDAAGNSTTATNVTIFVNNTPPPDPIVTPPVTPIPAVNPMGLVMDNMMDVFSIKTGLWSDPTTWSTGIVPTAGQCVWIKVGHTVTLDVVTANIHCLRVDGTFFVLRAGTTALNVNTIVVMEGGIHDAGTVGSPITGTHATNFVAVLNGSSALGPIDRVLDPFAFGLGIINMGTLRTYGAVKTPWEWLSVNPVAGATTLTLASAPTNWQIGDLITIPKTDLYGSSSQQSELRPILGISGATVTIAPLTFNHLVPATPAGLKNHVQNLTRNVVFQSSNTSDISRYGHAMTMTNDAITGYTEYGYLGRTNKAIPLNDTQVDANNVIIPGTGTNPRGRYSLHFHLCGTDKTTVPGSVVGCSFHNGPGWGPTNHGSYVNIDNNVGFNILGAVYVGERGDEVGRIDGNSAVKVPGSGLFWTNGVTTRQSIQDFAFEGQGIWAQGNGMQISNNVCADTNQCGINFYTKGLVVNGSPTTFPSINLPDPTMAGGRSTVSVGSTVVGADSTGNICYSCPIGVNALYLGAPQLTALQRSVFDGFLSWNCTRSWLVEYSSHCDFQNSSGVGGTYGVQEGPEALDDNRFINLTFTGTSIGIRLSEAGDKTVTSCNFVNCGKDIDVPGVRTDDRTITITGVTTSGALNEIFLETFVVPFSIFFNDYFMPSITTLDGVQLYGVEQDSTFVPFTSVSVPIPGAPAAITGLTNAQLLATYGISIAGAITPVGAVPVAGSNCYSGTTTVYPTRIRLVSPDMAPHGSPYTLQYFPVGQMFPSTWPTPFTLTTGWNILTITYLGNPRSFFVKGT